jgi:hypothetical protein
LSTAEDITEALAEAFDAIREELLGNADLYLLKLDGGGQKYKTLLVVSTGWAPPEFSEFSGSTTIKVAREDADFNVAVKDMSHVVITGSDHDTLNNRLFEVNGETTLPAGADAFCRIRVNETGRRYVPA